MKAQRFNVGSRERGFSLMEMVIVVAMALVLLALAVSWTSNASRSARKAQESDQLARELGMISTATRAHIAAGPDTTYPLNTNVAIPISTLTTAGLLPANFAARNGAGTPAISPFGQPYVVVARRIVAGEPPTAVVAESSYPLPEKLNKVGVESTTPDILAFKQAVAAQSGKDYKVIAASIPQTSRIATGVGNSFTKDLTAYFTAGFAQASAVSLINFKDLEPGDDDVPGGGFPPPKTYTGCSVMQGDLSNGITIWINKCSAQSGPGGMDMGNRIVGDRDMDPCGNGGRITVLPFGGTLTSGLNTSNLTYPDASYCPGDVDSTTGRCRKLVGYTYGIITMNSVQIASLQCKHAKYDSAGIYRETNTQVASYNVCCHVTE